MVAGLAFLATAIATLFAEATFVRWTRKRSPHLGAWTISLALFAVASGALAVGVSTGWDKGTFRVFFLAGAVLTVPWLALGTVALLLSPTTTRRVRTAVIFFSGLSVGVMLSAPMIAVSGTEIPIGSDVFGPLPRVLAAIGSGVGAIVVIAGSVVSIFRFARDRTNPHAGRMVGANVLITIGVVVLSSGGLLQGLVGHDEAFALTLTIGIAIIYAGFLIAEGRTRPEVGSTSELADESASWAD
jgi:hypothetical protein